MTLDEAKAYAPNARVGDLVRIERTPENFGRIAAQTVKQVVLQKIRDYERDTVYEEFSEKQGDLLTGAVQRADARAVIVELGTCASGRYTPGRIGLSSP